MYKRKPYVIGKPIPDHQLELLLKNIGNLVKQQREQRTIQERLSFEIGVNKSQIINCELGRPVSTATFLRILYGLEITPAEFFKLLDKTPGGG